MWSLDPHIFTESLGFHQVCQIGKVPLFLAASVFHLSDGRITLIAQVPIKDVSGTNVRLSACWACAEGSGLSVILGVTTPTH